MRRREKEIRDRNQILDILEKVKYITVAMWADNEPYLVTLNRGYDRANQCLYFHCAKERKCLRPWSRSPISATPKRRPC